MAKSASSEASRRAFFGRALGTVASAAVTTVVVRRARAGRPVVHARYVPRHADDVATSACADGVVIRHPRIGHSVLNEGASYLYELVDDQRSVEDIAAIVSRETGEPASSCLRDAIELFQLLANRGFVRG